MFRASTSSKCSHTLPFSKSFIHVHNNNNYNNRNEIDLTDVTCHNESSRLWTGNRKSLCLSLSFFLFTFRYIYFKHIVITKESLFDCRRLALAHSIIVFCSLLLHSICVGSRALCDWIFTPEYRNLCLLATEWTSTRMRRCGQHNDIYVYI